MKCLNFGICFLLKTLFLKSSWKNYSIPIHFLDQLTIQPSMYLRIYTICATQYKATQNVTIHRDNNCTSLAWYFLFSEFPVGGS